ncbi:ABC transporter type 1, transmembrane domain-containing protein [Lentinula edodes]|nr:ABC transporter type 1, transmembrane domain-containing protein [Lentinula edodes]
MKARARLGSGSSLGPGCVIPAAENGASDAHIGISSIANSQVKISAQNSAFQSPRDGSGPARLNPVRLIGPKGSEPEPAHHYFPDLFGYAGIVTLTVIINCRGTLNYVWGTVRASGFIHRRMVNSILGTTMRWLDKTPVSRIITRSTQDMNTVDASITQSFCDFVDACICLLSRLAAIVLFSPIFLLPGFLLLLIGTCIGKIYFKAQMSVKRQMSIAKAPLLRHFGATMAGLTYGTQELPIAEMQNRTDHHSRITRIFNNLQRWMAVSRINMLSAVFTSSLPWYLVYVLHQSASVTGFWLNMSVSVSSAIFGFISQSNALEAPISNVSTPILQSNKNQNLITGGTLPHIGLRVVIYVLKSVGEMLS